MQLVPRLHEHVHRLGQLELDNRARHLRGQSTESRLGALCVLLHLCPSRGHHDRDVDVECCNHNAQLGHLCRIRSAASWVRVRSFSPPPCARASSRHDDSSTRIRSLLCMDSRQLLHLLHYLVCLHWSQWSATTRRIHAPRVRALP